MSGDPPLFMLELEVVEFLILLLPILQLSKISANLFAMAAERHCSPNASCKKMRQMLCYFRFSDVTASQAPVSHNLFGLIAIFGVHVQVK